MRVIGTQDRNSRPTGAGRPLVHLRADRWDDYGFKTAYTAELYLSNEDPIQLGMVKILKRGLETSATTIALPRGNIRLGEEYCSLGQNLSYYERLIEHLTPAEYRDYLIRMQDLAWLPDRYALFAGEPALETSLLREGGARRALVDGPQLLQGSELDSTLKFSFNTSVGGDRVELAFSFGDVDEIPSRINAVIGYNGVGKTRLMANLAHVAWQSTRDRRAVAESYGVLSPADIPFGRVIAISYSAFDTFETPRPNDAEATQRRGYVYCGLRDLENGDTNRLKSANEIAVELETSLARLQTRGRWSALDAALAPMFREPSFQLSSTSIDFQASEDEWRPVFDALSTGHKISLNMIVQLVAHLENKSLVLLDEPESHLHPPLLAALMKGVSVALSERTPSR